MLSVRARGVLAKKWMLSKERSAEDQAAVGPGLTDNVHALELDISANQKVKGQM